MTKKICEERTEFKVKNFLQKNTINDTLETVINRLLPLTNKSTIEWFHCISQLLFLNKIEYIFDFKITLPVTPIFVLYVREEGKGIYTSKVFPP